MAEKVSDPNLKQVFVGLAKEESKHKLFFETEYEERVLMHN
jgi:rubrerythrin